VQILRAPTTSVVTGWQLVVEFLVLQLHAEPPPFN
jgi:hypothetical protein